MSYEVTLVENESHVSENLGDAYHITDAGVLQLITEADTKDRFISIEFSPAAWISVIGTRYIGDTEVLASVDSKIVNGTRFTAS
ncbi:hypothetical protein [Glutamicibacter sp. MCAF14]|uniref:hypothetical protein n=1 Tax=Glutamicibacter sp. MCAF14 TaxID=3233043 RepID=UPI003F928B81